jgi:hypothetical protein
MTVRPDGYIEWRNQQGKYHREDAPAREWPAQGTKAWNRNGKLDRDDGLAMERRLGKSWHRNPVTASIVMFRKNPHAGRYGLFPIEAEQTASGNLQQQPDDVPKTDK